MKSNLNLTKKDIVAVLACVFFLLMNLGAIGARGNEHAKRILCASRLQKWGQAIFMHSADNDDNLMFMIRRWSEGPFPHLMGMVKDGDYERPGLDPEAEPGEWDVYRINPYIGAFSETYYPPTDCQINDLIACPSASEDFMVGWNTDNCEWDWSFLEPGYSYWVIGGMPEKPRPSEASNFIYQDLTVDTLSPDRLLMSDILSKDAWPGQGDPYRYNHGKTGWSWFHPDAAIGHIIYDPNPVATGRSQAFGDGHIEWRDISLKKGENIPTETTDDDGETNLKDRWNGPGSGWIQEWNVSWY